MKGKVDDKVRQLKSTIVPQQTKSVLQDDNVIRYLAEFHKKYVLVQIDKASNNIAIIRHICVDVFIDVVCQER